MNVPIGSISRQPSPHTMEAASGLLFFNSSNPKKTNSSYLNSTAPTSFANPNVPATSVAAGKNATSVFGRQITLHGDFMRSIAGPMIAAQTSQRLISDMLDGNLSASRRPCINRPIDHDYTDYAPISESELKQLDEDDSILNSPTLSPQKKRLLEQLRRMESKSGVLAQSFPAKVRPGSVFIEHFVIYPANI